MLAADAETSDSSSGSSIRSSLLERVREHDPQAWRRLVDLFSPLIYDWCRGQGLQAADAADVMQEVFHSVAAHVGKFRRDRPGDSFRGWLWTVTRSKIGDHLRSRATQVRGQGGSDAQLRLQSIPASEPPSVEALDASGESHTEVAKSPMQRALDAVRVDFNETTWQAFLGVTRDGRSAAEVAGELGVSVNAVRKAKARVLRRLRDEFGDLLT